MVKIKQTALVLGAGSSKPYGFPLASELKEQILSLTAAGKFEQWDPSWVEKFHTRFEASDSKSIDSFLEKEFGFREIGRQLIAKVLLNAEKFHSDTSNSPIDDDWIEMVADAGFEASQSQVPDYSWLKVVTFNYDRLLEWRLACRLAARMGCPVWKIFETSLLPTIVHAYGHLGSVIPAHRIVSWSASTWAYIHVPFGGAYPETLKLASASIEVMPESTIGTTAFQMSRKILRDSLRVFFLGFGHHEDNITRLFFHGGALHLSMGTNEPPFWKFVRSTAVCSTPEDRDKWNTRLFPEGWVHGVNFIKPSPDQIFHPISSSDLLSDWPLVCLH